MIGLPETDRTEAIKMRVKSFRKLEPEKLLRDDVNADAAAAAQLEHQVLMNTGQMPPPQAGQDHQTHVQFHNQFLQSIVPQIQQGATPPTVFQAVQQHIQQTEQIAAQDAGALGQPPPSLNGGPTTIQGQVQSNAQKVASAIEQNAGEAPF